MLKRPLLAVLPVALVLLVLVVPCSGSVARFDTAEVVLHASQSFDSRTGSPNPFDVSLTATVTSPSGRVYPVRGFFDGNGSGGPVGNVFKIRIAADEAGTWRWTTASGRSELNGKTGTFTCSGSIPGILGIAGPFRDGPIIVDPDRRQVFRYREGRPVYLTGKFLDVDAPDPLLFSQTMFSEDLSESDRENLFARHQGMGLNKMSVYLANKGDYQHVSTTPWVGTAAGNDKNRFDLGRWHLYEDWVRRMRDAGIVAQLWFFADDSGFGDLPDAQRKRLIQYGMARLSGYVNTVFTLVLEWQEGWTQAEVETHAQYLHANNPWDRLVSVHGVPGHFDWRLPGMGLACPSATPFRGNGAQIMDKANIERIQLLLRRHEQVVEEKRMHPEEFLRQNEQFQEAFGRVARATIVPVLEEVKDILVGKVESASIFHRRTAGGLKVKLDRWEDFERSLLFFGDASTQTVRVTHEGVGFSLLSQKLSLSQVTAELVEEEAMKFLKRLFGQEQLRRPLHVPDPADRRRPMSSSPSSAVRPDYDLVRV